MPQTTPVYGFHYLAPGDGPDIAGITQQIANDLEGFFGAARVDNSTSTTMSVTPAGTDCAVTTWDGGVTFNVGTCVTFSGGIFTIVTAGVYRWDVTVAYPPATATYRVQQKIRHNGVNDPNGAQSTEFANGTPTLNVTSGGVIQCAANDTLQLFLNCDTAGLTGVNHRAFTITRVA